MFFDTPSESAFSGLNRIGLSRMPAGRKNKAAAFRAAARFNASQTRLHLRARVPAGCAASNSFVQVFWLEDQGGIFAFPDAPESFHR